MLLEQLEIRPALHLRQGGFLSLAAGMPLEYHRPWRSGRFREPRTGRHVAVNGRPILGGRGGEVCRHKRKSSAKLVAQGGE